MSNANYPLESYNDLEISGLIGVARRNTPLAEIVPGLGAEIEWPIFTANRVREIQTKKELPHGWKMGSGLFFHAHTMPISDEAAGTIVMKLDAVFCAAATGSTPSSEVTIRNDIIINANTSLQMYSQENATPIDLSAYNEVGLQCAFRFYRDTDDAADTYPGSITVWSWGHHFLNNAAGSVGRFTK